MIRMKGRLLAAATSILLLIPAATACSVDEPSYSMSESDLTGSAGHSTTVFSSFPSETDETDTTAQTVVEETTADTAAPTTKGTATTKSSLKQTTTTTKKIYPKPNTGQELRGVWVAYMELDERFKGKTIEQAKSAIDSIMINAKAYGLNAIFFHVRSHSNAYYKSNIFKPAAGAKALIDAGFDPLKYAVEAAHSRGLELHAWINPYRIGSSANFPKDFNSFKENEDYFKSGGNYYFNPASDKSIQLIVSGIDEIVKNYDVDGIHFDDYFYPSDTAVVPQNSPGAFEKSQYEKYKSGGGKLGIGDWRRQKVSKLIKDAYSKVHGIRKDCVFGVSPRGVQEQNRDVVYADVEEWMKNKGYIDYVCPQIYFGFEHGTRPFDKTVNEWINMDLHDSVRLYIGLALHKIGSVSDQYAGKGKEEWKNHDDIMKRSLLYVRSKPECDGVIFFRYAFFMPAQMPESSDWVRAVAVREIENLLTVLKP